MRRPGVLYPASVLILILFVGGGPACHRASAPAAPAPPTAPAPTFTPPSAPGEVGPLGTDCYDTKQAKACPPDPE